MDPNLLIALLGMLGQGGNSYYPYGSSPQSGTGLDSMIQMFSMLFPNSGDQSLNNYYSTGSQISPYIDMYGRPTNLSSGNAGGSDILALLSSILGGAQQNNYAGTSNAASALFQYLFGSGAGQQAINYQQTQPQQGWYNSNSPYYRNPDGTYSYYNYLPAQQGATQNQAAATGTYQSPYGPAVQQGGTPPPFTGYAAPGPQGQGYSPSLGPSGYIEVNGQPTWSPGTGALGGVEGTGGNTKYNLPAGTQTPTAWGPQTLGANGVWSQPGNMPNLSTVAHGLYGGDVPTMVGPNGQILYNPSGINGQPFDRTRGWVTWDQMDDITTKWYTDRGLALPAELANANAARGAGNMPQQRASWGNTGLPGYVAPGTTTKYTPSPGYTPPSTGIPPLTPPAGGVAPPLQGTTGTAPGAGTVGGFVNSGNPPPPVNPYAGISAPHEVTGATAGMTGQVPGGKNMTYSAGGIPYSDQQVANVKNSLGAGFFNPQSTYNNTLKPQPPPQGMPASQGTEPYWDARAGRYYDPVLRQYK